ncbi:L-arabinose-binding periplasmic protein [Escherichia coli]|uniref:L-arabinose-binding periplasmic protein n=1 Tax=Escherichia coli TaxID=562 RepID=A0A3S4L4A9_ECOLX|nr:L-arabinose-binding periplasmic protein [Escherichia coli]
MVISPAKCFTTGVAKGVEPTKFTEVTDVVLITRDNFKEELEKKGLGGK